VRQTKIIATVGPASDSDEQIRALVEAGVDVFRINASHGDYDAHTRAIRMGRGLADRSGRVPGIFRKGITEADPAMVLDTLRNSSFSAFLVAQHAAKLMLTNTPGRNGAKGTIIFTNASAAIKGYAKSGAFAMASHAKLGLAESMARELMPEGIHVVHVPIDAAIGWTQDDGTRAHRLAGTTVDDNMADPDHIAQTYLQLHRQHRSTWAFEVVLRPWVEKW